MNRKRLGYIDTARGMAAISVMIFHSVLSISQNDSSLVNISKFFKDFFDLGKIAVIIFFIISGLVIPYSITGADKKNQVKKFIISRFFRLYPVYWLSAILGFVVFRTFSIFELSINFTMFQQFVGIRNIIGLYWTLQIELIFYFLIALVFVIGKLRSLNFLYLTSLLFLLLSVLCAFIRGYHEIKLPLAIPLALSLMFFGSFFRRQLIDKEKKVNRFTLRYLIAYFILIPVVCKLGYDSDFGFGENWLKYVITYYSGVTLFIAMGKFKISSSITEYLGRISYSVYLFHPIVIYLVTNNINLSWYYSLTIIILLTLLFSHFTFKLIESPSIGFGKKIKTILINRA